MIRERIKNVFNINNTNKFKSPTVFSIVILILIIYLAYFIRLRTAYVDIPLDYDPWWFFRHARDIVERWDKEKKFVLTAWDSLSFFPPGRPIYYDGYSYTIALSYLILRNFLNLTIEKFSIHFVAFFSALTAIPAFFLAKYLTKNLFAGLLSAFIITLSPSFLTVSMAGYVDSDVVYVFYTYLCLFFTILLIDKVFELRIDFIRRKNLNKLHKLLPFMFFVILSYLLFAWNWNSAYYILQFIIAFYVFYWILQSLFLYFFSTSKKENNFILKSFFETINIGIPILITVLIIEIITAIIKNTFNFILPSPIMTLLGHYILAFRGGLKNALLVNISVAELQILNPFSREAIIQIVQRVGLIPFIASFLLFPIFLYNFFIKKFFNWKEIFLLSWFMISLYLISQGVRFSLLFAVSLAIISSYSIFVGGNILFSFFSTISSKNNIPIIKLLNVLFFSLIFIFGFYYLDYSFKVANAMKGMEISQNWREALEFIKKNSDERTLVATWWDPGHIIAGYSRVKVHADGAHCDPNVCIPYSHNIRIQDMGRILTTSNESEAYEILKKYTRISEDECKKIKSIFPNIFEEKICNININKIYFIASQDLIFKYYWPYYFSSCLRKYYPDNSLCYTQMGIEKFFYEGKNAEGKSYSIFIFNNKKSDINKGLLVYSAQANIGGIIREIDITIKVDSANNQTILTAYLLNKERIRYVVFYQNNKPIIIDQELLGRKSDINAMVILDWNLEILYLADEDIMNSMFTKMYFLNGMGLEKFKLVFENSEVKIYEINF